MSLRVSPCLFYLILFYFLRHYSSLFSSSILLLSLFKCNPKAGPLKQVVSVYLTLCFFVPLLACLSVSLQKYVSLCQVVSLPPCAPSLLPVYTISVCLSVSVCLH